MSAAWPSVRSKRIAFSAQVGTKWSIVADGQQLAGGYDNSTQPVFSPDGRRIAYAAKIGQSKFLATEIQ